ncbi:MAG: urea transport system ATP-binding protein, partial [Celeribacter sp.]
QPNIIQQIGRVIALLRDRGDMAIVLVEQYFEFAYDLADQLVFMERGRVTSTHDKADITKDEAAKVFRIA